MKMQKLWYLATALALLASPAVSAKKRVSEPKTKTVVCRIKGMHCGSCAGAIQSSLQQVQGVKAATVDYNKAEAVVKIDTTKTNEKEVVKAIEQGGFQAEVKQ